MPDCFSSTELAIDCEGDLTPEVIEMIAGLLVDAAFAEDESLPPADSGIGPGEHSPPH